MQLALEIISDISAGNDDAQGQDDWDDNVDMDNMDIGDEEQQQQLLLTPLNSEAIAVLMYTSVSCRIIAFCAHCPSHILQVFALSRHGQPLLDKYFIVQARALGVMNNILMTANQDNACGQQQLFKAYGIDKLWAALNQLVSTLPLGYTKDVLTPITQTMWSLLRRFNGVIMVDSNNSHVIRNILQLPIKSDDNTEVCVHVAGMVGLLCNIQNSTSDQDLQLVVQFLLANLKNKNPLVIAESINSLFDVFVDERHNLYTTINAHSLLSNSLPQLKNKINQYTRDKVYPDTQIYRAKEALLNLRRFIEYKKGM